MRTLSRFAQAKKLPTDLVKPAQRLPPARTRRSVQPFQRSELRRFGRQRRITMRSLGVVGISVSLLAISMDGPPVVRARHNLVQGSPVAAPVSEVRARA